MFAEVIPGLIWIGDEESSRDLEGLRERNIEMIINCAASDIPCLFADCCGESEIDYLKLPIDDDPNDPILYYLYQVCDFIKIAEERCCAVLVHCGKGVSRSAAIILMYLIYHEEMSFEQAHQFLQSVKPEILPNIGFQRQLQILEKRVHGSKYQALAS